MSRELITFDWAIKRLLRRKANFGILEGFLSELLREDIHIVEVLESESNQNHEKEKFNRVDLKVKNSKQDIIIVEIQYDREHDYLHRIFYAVSKAALEHMETEHSYSDVAKVISVNIMYFDLGSGTDYVYHGTTRFIGLHDHDVLQLSKKQKELFRKESVEALYPEYYLIKINKFDDIARDTLDEWIYFLKNEEIRQDFTAKGLKEAAEKLSIMKLPMEERKAYERYIDDLRYQKSMYNSTYVDGFTDGEKEGLLKGLLKGREEGREEGLLKGKSEGHLEGKSAMIERQLTRRLGSLTEAIQTRIRGASHDELERWADNILDAETLDEVFSGKGQG